MAAVVWSKAVRQTPQHGIVVHRPAVLQIAWQALAELNVAALRGC